MNKNRYRIIFSQARGMFIAVAETVKSRTKNTGQSVGGETVEIKSPMTALSYKKINPLNFAVISLLGAVIYTLPLSSIADSQIVADKSAPNAQQATILNTSNGVTQVNIQTPSAGGVSRNTYTQFDVGQEGAILNNSRNNVQTQIGGWVQGNPWLAKGEAKVILNEVNSSNPSQLKGYLEVAGKSAQVVIANPSGLVCDGCGVINADRFTLTTGQAVVNQGYLESFRVREGQVTIEGKGLNGSLTPYTDIYARALQVSAGLYANELNTVLGQNDIDVKEPNIPQVKPSTPTTQSTNSPSYALDVGQLGGMYAGKIYLVGTEQGLGVRNAGSINASSGTLTLNANGDLANTGNIIANKDQIGIQAHNVANNGNISSTQSKIQVDATDIQNSGLIATNDELKLNAQANINNNDGVINAGRIDLSAQNLSNDKGQIQQTGLQQLNITAKTLDNSQGVIGQAKQDNTTGTQTGTTVPPVTNPEQNSSAQDSSSITVAEPTDLTPKIFDVGQIQIAQDIHNVSGQILNNADIYLNVKDSIKNNGGEIQLPELQFNGQNFENQEGKFTAKLINIVAQTVNNQQGLIDATESFDLNAQQLNNNEGRLQSAKTLNLTAKQIDNSKGQILATEALVLNSDNTNNTEGVIASVNSDATLNITSLDNSKGEISAQNVQLTGQTLNNQQGSIQSKTGDLILKVDQINNGLAQDTAGNLIAAKNLNITAQQLNSTGQIYAGDTADLTVQQLQQDGQLAALNKIKVQSDNITSQPNAIWASGLDQDGKLSNTAATLNIDAQQVQIAGTALSGESLTINATKNADLSQSATQAKNIKINTQELNTSNAKIIADQQLEITGKQSINHQQGQYSAAQVNIDTAQLNNDQGLIQHTGQNDFILNVADRIDNNSGKIISNANNTEIKTTNLSSIAGEILHAGDQQLKITAQNLQGQQGKIQSNSNIQLELGTANLDNAVTTAQNINIDATTLSHKQGQLIQSDANGQLNLNVAQNLNNTAGVISAAGNAALNMADLNNQQGVIQTLTGKDLKITSQKLDNQSGQIIAGRDAQLQVAQLNNDQGTVYAEGQLDITAAQDITNQQGLIASQQALNLNGQNLNNQTGQIQSEQSDVNLKLAQSINNQSGNIQSAKSLKVDTAQLDNQSGQLISGADSQLNVAHLNNQSGTIYSKNQLALNASGTVDNSLGTLAAEQNINLNAQQLLNDAGQIRSENADVTANVTQNIENNAGLISATKDLNLTAQDVHSQKGKLQSGADTSIQVNHLDNTEGVVYVAEQLQLNVQGELNNSKGVVAAEQLAALKAGSIINDAGQIRSQQDQLKLNVQNELSNLAGEISANKVVELSANKLNNQNGKVIAGTSLNATAQQIDNTAGTIYAQDRLNLNVADQLNNQSGTIAANQQVQIQVNNLNNNVGKIRSEQNQLDLNVQQTLDNQSGEIFAASNAKINATTLNNQQGTVYSKNQLDLTAGQLNNQQGQVYSAGAANVTIQGDVQNQKGVIVAGQNLNLQSQNLDNTEGTLGSEQADLTVNAQGQLINQQGDIYAGQNTNLNTQTLVNTAGQIASQNQLSIDTQQQQLSNQNGKIIAKVVDLKTGILDNQIGLVQGEQSVKIDTQNHALLNNNSGTQAGILSQGSLNIANVSQLDSVSGYIAAVGTANITAQNINNNAGQINSQTNLNIQQQISGGQIDNVAGKIQAQQNVNLTADTINNAGISSHIIAGEKLTATAQKVLNTGTKDATVLGGLDAKNIEINASVLDNQSGVIRATDQANLNINTQLNNQAGSISSLNSLNIGTADKTLNVNNTGGELLAKNRLNLKANELINQGKMISEGDVDIDLKQSYTHTSIDQIAANGTLKLSTEQDLINQSELIAGQKVELSAQNIDNQAGATISSNETHLTAVDTVHNQGLINGELTHIQANRVWNDGARIYGTNVAIQANTLDNKSNTAGTGAVIASRGDMDLGIGTLNNQSGDIVKESARDNAWIFSAGNLNIGGSLDGDLKAQDSANTINNLSARIESLGDMTLMAKNINNINQNFQTEIVQIGGAEEKVYIQPDDKTTKISVENLIKENWSRTYLYKYDTTPNELPENVILGETPIPNVESINCVGTGEDESCNVNYKKDDPVWAYFKITPPSKDAPTAPNMVEPVPPTGQVSCEAGAGYDAVACTAYQTAYTQYEKDNETYQQGLAQYKKDLDAWSGEDEDAYQALSDAVAGYNETFGDSKFKKWTQYNVEETKFESQVIHSSPAEIIAGGDINVYGDAFTNDKSQVLAGNTLNVQIAKENLTQIDGKGLELLKQTGKVKRSVPRWRGGFKRYYQRRETTLNDNYNVTEQNEIDLPVSQWLGNVENHTSNQNISAAKTSQNAVVNNSVDTPDQQQDRQQQSQQINVNTNAGQAISEQGQQAKAPMAPDQLEVKTLVDSNVETQQNQAQSVDSAKNIQAGATNTLATQSQGDIEIRSVLMETLNLPSNALFSTHQDSQSKYLVETDPAFINYKNWLSSDYMLDAMELDPATKQKRLGDGYYEQRLVQDQIAQLTGHRFLQGYSNDEEQYKALMNSALSFAKLYNLRPGIALTAAQIAQLTTDIVWFEEKTVKLADGATTKALVPQVYVKARAGDLKGDGTLISADQIKIQVNGDVLNNATIAGREVIKISADNINQLSGRMQANQIDLKTTKDFNNIGGTITAVESVNLNIDGDFNQSSTTQKIATKVGASEFTSKGFDRKAGIYITGTPLLNQANSNENLRTTLNIQVGGNTTLKGSEILNNNGSTIIKTHGDLNVEGVNTLFNSRGQASKDNFIYEKKQEDIGSVIRSVGDIRLQAENIRVKGSQISSEQGSTLLSAQKNIDISEGRKVSDTEQAYKFKDKGMLSTTVTKTHTRNMSDEAIASTIDGKNVILDANNIDIRGSNVVSDDLTQIQAKENVTITGAQNQYLNYSESSVKKSGLMSSDGIGFSVGSQKERTEQEQTQHTNTGSTVGSLKGNTNIIAGKTYQQTGSTVSSQQGDVNILAQQVNIEAAKEQSTSDYKHEMEQKGLTLAVNVPVVSAVQSVLDSSKQVGQSSNDRVNAMAAANAGFDAYKSGQSLGKLAGALSDASKLNKSMEVGVSLTYGEQKSINTSHSESNTASQSQVYAGGKTSIVATGAGKDSNINIIGSDVVGMQGTHLAADNDVNIKAAEQKMTEESSNKSSGWNAGVTISNQTGFGVTAGGNLGKGKGNGTDTSYANSHVGSKDSLTTISSGGTTNIIGGQIQGKGIQIDANELNIESLQDTATYKSKQQDISGQVSVGTNGGNASGSFSKSNVNANYASVNEQSGIFAGDDGYQINVKNNTDLKGAIITSTQAAEDLKKNSLNTGTLTKSDIQNISEYDAKGIGISGGFNSGKSDSKGEKQPATVASSPSRTDQHASSITGVSKSIGFGLDSENDSSVTKSGINTSNITIHETVRQQELTGKSAEQIKSEILTDVTTDTARENSGALNNNFDRNKVKSEINLQVDVTQAFDANRQEVKAEINKKLDEAKKENQSILDKEKQGQFLTSQEQDQLKVYNDKVEKYQNLGVLLDTISTGLSAPTSSGLGIATATLSPKVSYEIGQYFKGLANQNADGKLTVGQEAAHILAHTVLGAAVASAGGNDALTAGLSAGGAEASAPLLSKYLYGKEAKDLTADEKSTISAITGLAASGIGATTGDVASTVQSGQVAQTAVEENGFTIIDENYGKIVEKNKKEKWFCPTGYICPIPEKTLGEKAILVINDLTVRQLAAALGATYDPLTGGVITPKERQDAKVAMLGLGFSKTLSGPIKLTDEAIENIGKKYGEDLTYELFGSNIFSPSSKNPLAKDAIPRNTNRLVVNQGATPTCGHNSCAMVLDTLGKPVNVESLIATIKPSPDGILSQQVSTLLSKNNVENISLNGRTINDLGRYTDKGTPVIVRIIDSKNPKEFSHFIVVDGITERAGKKVVAIRDPHGKSYFSPVDTFKKAFTGEAIIPRNYK